MKRLRLSLGVRLSAVGVFVLALMSITLFVELTAREHAKLMSAKTSAALMLTQLLANELAAAIDFDDLDDAMMSLNFLRSNPDIIGAAVWTNQGPDEPVARWAAPGAPSTTRPGPDEPDGVSLSPDWLVATRSIIGQHNKQLARVRVQFTLRSENEAYRSNRRQLFWMTAGLSAIASVLFGLFARRYVVGPIKLLASAATALADGKSSARVDVPTNNEVGDLARAFNAMSRAVVSREEQLRARNGDMQLVLDHVAQGLFTIDREGVISSEYSRALDDWLGPPSPADTLWSYLAKVDPDVASQMRWGWEAVIEHILPLELTLDQMPKSLWVGERLLRAEYLPILANGTLSKVLVVLSDITSDVARERADEAQRELLRVFEHFTKDREGFNEFFAEADGLVAKITETTEVSAEVKRMVHTLKGNCAQFGLASVADLCHRLEGGLAESGKALDESERGKLRRAWSVTREKLSMLLIDHSGARMEIEETEYEGVLADLDAGVCPSRVAYKLRRWRLEPTAQRLDRVARQAVGLAQRLGKAGVRVVAEPNALRLDARAWAPFWSAFVHVLRNALDHGIEADEERVAAGKPVPGTLTIRTYVTGHEFFVEAADDGRGMDWAALAARCRELGLPYASRRDVEEALLGGGLSTKTEVTEHSGRGVGMGAFGAACAARGGSLHIQAVVGGGTLLQCRFPASAMGDGEPRARHARVKDGARERAI